MKPMRSWFGTGWAALMIGCAVDDRLDARPAGDDTAEYRDASTSPDVSALDAAPNRLVEITDEGHLDVLSIHLVEGMLALDIDRFGFTRLIDPAEALIVLPVTSRTRLVGMVDLTFLGEPGSRVWNLDAGWSVRGVPAGTFRDDELQVQLWSVSGPGNFAIWRFNDASLPAVDFASTRPMPQMISISHRAHTHRRWSFTAPGTYRIDFSVTGTRADNDERLSSSRESYTFEVRNE